MTAHLHGACVLFCVAWRGLHYRTGKDGPHYSPDYPNPLHRNSSFGLATLRQDGFIALKARDGKGSGKTTPLEVGGAGAGARLVLTADTDCKNGAVVQITVNGKVCRMSGPLGCGNQHTRAVWRGAAFCALPDFLCLSCAFLCPPVPSPPTRPPIPNNHTHTHTFCLSVFGCRPARLSRART